MVNKKVDLDKDVKVMVVKVMVVKVMVVKVMVVKVMVVNVMVVKVMVYDISNIYNHHILHFALALTVSDINISNFDLDNESRGIRIEHS